MRLKPDMTSFRCEYCLSVYLPEANTDDGVRVLGEPSGQNCPVCSTDLAHATLSNIRVRYCAKCRGILVPMGALQSLVEELRSQTRGATIPPAADATELRRKIDCPQCHRHMDAHFYAGPGHVIIDSCENCSSIWLDGGELTRIVQAPEEQFATSERLLTSPMTDDSPGSAYTAIAKADLAADVVSTAIDWLLDK
jgi:Zn-finger nucleic acid-binding protein